jgi:hypothetical protein
MQQGFLKVRIGHNAPDGEEFRMQYSKRITHQPPAQKKRAAQRAALAV